MNKRVKARVKRSKRVSDEYAEEIICKGRWLTEHRVVLENGNEVRINNIRYNGEVYFVVRIGNYAGVNIKECIEL